MSSQINHLSVNARDSKLSPRRGPASGNSEVEGGTVSWRAVDTAGNMAAIVISLAWRNTASAGSAAPRSITPQGPSAASVWLGRVARHLEPHGDGWMRGLIRPFARDGRGPGSPS